MYDGARQKVRDLKKPYLSPLITTTDFTNNEDDGISQIRNDVVKLSFLSESDTKNMRKPGMKKKVEHDILFVRTLCACIHG